MFVIQYVLWGLTSDHRPFHLAPDIMATKFQDGNSQDLQSIQQDKWMFPVTQRVAYLQVPIHPDLNCFKFVCQGVVDQLKALCFGIITAPVSVITVLISPVSTFSGICMTGSACSLSFTGVNWLRDKVLNFVRN